MAKITGSSIRQVSSLIHRILIFGHRHGHAICAEVGGYYLSLKLGQVLLFEKGTYWR